MWKQAKIVNAWERQKELVEWIEKNFKPTKEIKYKNGIIHIY